MFDAAGVEYQRRCGILELHARFVADLTVGRVACLSQTARNIIHGHVDRSTTLDRFTVRFGGNGGGD
jgi:hypothetical protein